MGDSDIQSYEMPEVGDIVQGADDHRVVRILSTTRNWVYQVERIRDGSPGVAKIAGAHSWEDKWTEIHERTVMALTAMADEPSVVNLVDTVQSFSRGGKPADAVGIIEEYVDGCTLRDVQRQVSLPVDTILDFLGLTAAMLSRFEKRGIVYRDLQSENTLLAKSYVDQILAGASADIFPGCLKAMDLELAMSPKERIPFNSVECSAGFAAPEFARGRYGNAYDIFSWGLLAWNLLVGEHPLEYRQKKCVTRGNMLARLLTLEEGQLPPFPRKLEGVESLINQSLRINLLARPTAETAAHALYKVTGKDYLAVSIPTRSA